MTRYDSAPRLTALALFAASCAGPSQAPNEPAEVRLTRVTLDEFVWSDDVRAPAFIREGGSFQAPVILGHVEEWHGFPPLERFTAEADKEFLLEAPGKLPVRAMAGTGGVTSSDGRLRFVILRPRDVERLDRSIAYTPRPLNRPPGPKWYVAAILPPLEPAPE